MTSPLDFFQAGQAGGNANSFPGVQASGNLLDVFNKQLQMQMALQQQAGLFKGEHEYLNQTDPQKIESDYKNRQLGIGPYANGGSGGNQGAPLPDAGNGQPTSGAQISPNGGMMLKSQDQGINKFENTEVPAQEQLMKDRLNQDVSYSALNSAITTHLGAVKAYHNTIGSGGILPNTTASFAATGGDPQVSIAKQSLDTANETLAQRIAKEVNPGGIGRILSSTRQQVGGENATEGAQLAANIQLKKDYYGFKKAYDMANISNPMDKQVLFNPDGTKKDFNNLSDNEAAYLASIKNKAVQPWELQSIDDETRQQYDTMEPTPIIDPRTHQVFTGPSRSATLMAPIGNAISKMPGIGAFVGPNAGFPVQDQNNKSQPKSALHAAAGKSKYTMGQIITAGNNKKYKVVGLSDPNDPDLEPT